MTDDERSEADNAIWLCTICHTIVDNDAGRYPVETLRMWRANAEMLAHSRLGKQPTAESSAAPLVASYNQSGGQTALIINNNERQRPTLEGAQIPAQLHRRMRARPAGKVVVVAHGSDGDTVALAEEFAGFVNDIGWSERVEDIATLHAPAISLRGIRIQSSGIGADDPLRALAEWVHTLGMLVQFMPGRPTNCVEVGYLR